MVRAVARQKGLPPFVKRKPLCVRPPYDPTMIVTVLPGRRAGGWLAAITPHRGEDFFHGYKSGSCERSAGNLFQLSCLGRTFGRSHDVSSSAAGSCGRGTEERMSTLRADAAAFVPCSQTQQSQELSGAKTVISSSSWDRHPPNKNHRRRPRRRIQSTNKNAKKGRAADDEQSRNRKDDSRQQEVFVQQRHRGPKTTKRQTTGERMLGRRQDVSGRQRDATGNNRRRNVDDRNNKEAASTMLEPTLFPALVRKTKSAQASSGNLGQPQARICWSETSTAIRAPPLAAHGITDDSEEPDGISSWVTNKKLDLLPPLMMRRTGTAALGEVRSNDPQPPIPTGSAAADEPVCSALAGDAGDPYRAVSKTRTANIVDKESLERTHHQSDASLLLRMSMLPQRRAIDISKLRDRWWDLVEEHNQKLRDEHQQHRKEAEQGNASSSASTTTVNNDGVTEPHCLDGDGDLSCALSSSTCSDLSDYDDKALTIHEMIRRDDVDALERLLLRTTDNYRACPEDTVGHQTSMSPLQLAVHLNRPQLVRVLCRAFERATRERKDNSTPDTSLVDSELGEDWLPPLLMAAENGSEECLQILLSTFGTASLLTTRDSQGNTAFHCCCRGSDSAVVPLGTSTFNLLLNCAVASSLASRSSTSFLFKVLSSKNHQEQTPLHVACQYERADIVDCILTHRSTANSSLLSKIFDLRDVEGQTPLLAAVSSGSTDIVMSLLMWRGNNFASKKNGSSSSSSQPYDTNKYRRSAGLISTPTTNAAAPCPLLWAVRSNNVGMVSLLLEFNDPSLGSGYDLNDALYFAVNSQDVFDEIICVLVGNGANPCAIRDKSNKNGSVPLASLNSAFAPRSAIAAAAFRHDQTRLTAQLDSQKEYLDRIRSTRRRDPKLQKQPESFFTNMESAEDAKRIEAMRDALVISLYHIWLGLSSEAVDRTLFTSSFTACALALYRRGARPTEADIDRLKTSLTESKLVPFSSETNSFLPATSQYEAVYTRQIPSIKSESEKQYALQYYSRMMLELPWCNLASRFECAWINSVAEDGNETSKRFPDPDVILVCNDGEKFLVHGCVVSHASDRLAAAIRFAAMSQDPTEGSSTVTKGPLKMKIDMSAKFCRWMLEHMYHGSIASGLSVHPTECCRQLMELLLISEEYLCKSLVQECEMRLLSSNYCDQCFCCYCGAKGGSVLANGKPGKVECSFQVSGPSLVGAEMALDVLAVAQHVSGSCSESDYTLRVTKSTESKQMYAWSSMKQINCIVRDPLVALREGAVRTILCNFEKVVKSSAFATYFEDVSGGRMDALHGEEILLRMSLLDFSSFYCSAPESSEKSKDIVPEQPSYQSSK